MDLSFTHQQSKFNYRVGAIIIQNNHLLATYHDQDNYLYLPGGRVSFHESSFIALKRELNEELEISNFDSELIHINENFFIRNHISIHELGFYYLVQLKDNQLWHDTLTFTKVDELGHLLTFKWIPISKLDEYNLKPYYLKGIIQSHDFKFSHSINKEINHETINEGEETTS